MSERIALERLQQESARFGATPYLLTQGGDGRPHAVAVTVEWQQDRICLQVGSRSAANVAAQPLLSLLWPPLEPGGYSLIVDGDGQLLEGGSPARLTVTPTRGVLHRPGTAAPASARGCGSDCVRLYG